MRARTNTWPALSTIAILSALTGACGDSKSDDSSSKSDAGKSTTVDAGAPGACGAQADGTPVDTSATGGCYYFYCEETKESLLGKSSKGGTCANETDVAIQCEGQSVRTVSDCARMKAGDLVIMGAEGFKKSVTTCARADKRLGADFSDGCLACNVESSLCAAKFCLGECVTGDSVMCDKCRETNKCTPDFYKCAGLPDPNK